MTVLLTAALLLGLYLFLLMPRMLHRPDTSVLCGWQYAHRGLHGRTDEAPENTQEAFRRAVAHGYGIELDVQLTKDEQVVVFHDATLNRVCKTEAAVRDRTYDELLRLRVEDSEERIPLLSEVLREVDGRVPLIIEIKMVDCNTRVCELTDQILRNYRGVYGIESFHPFAVRWYKKHRPDIIRGQLSADFSKEGDGKENWAMFAVHHLVTNVLCRPDFIAYSWKSKKAVGRTLCRKLFRCLSVAWTIRSEEEYHQAEDAYDLFIFEHFLPEGRSR